jgi:hypothetical protein
MRRQGYGADKSKETVLLDHSIQQHRLVPLVARCYGMHFATKKLQRLLDDFDATLRSRDATPGMSLLPELHATSAAMKGVFCEAACNLLEEARRCCGGFGYTMASGISSVLMNLLPSVTYEGDRHVMALQTGRALLRVLSAKRRPSAAPHPAMASGLDYLLKRSTRLPVITSAVDVDALARLWEGISRRAAVGAAKAYWGLRKAQLGHDEAWNRTHTLWVTAAHLHTWFESVRCFAAALQELRREHQNESMLRGLEEMARLHAVSLLQEVVPHRLAQLSHGEYQTLDALMHRLVRKCRDVVVVFTEGFGWSDSILGSLIAPSHGDAALMHHQLLEWARRSPLNVGTVRDEIHKSVLSTTLDADHLRGVSKL